MAKLEYSEGPQISLHVASGCFCSSFIPERICFAHLTWNIIKVSPMCIMMPSRRLAICWGILGTPEMSQRKKKKQRKKGSYIYRKVKRPLGWRRLLQSEKSKMIIRTDSKWNRTGGQEFVLLFSRRCIPSSSKLESVQTSLSNFARASSRIHTFRNEVVIQSGGRKICPLQHECLRFVKLRRFVAMTVCYEEAGFSRFQPIATKNDMFCQSKSTNNSRALRKQFHFWGCT